MDRTLLALVLSPLAAALFLHAFDRGGPPPLTAPLPAGAGEPQPIAGALLAQPNRTYFASLQTNGTVSAAASAANVKAQAEKLGFHDVAVFTVRPANWPGRAGADYFVRATYNANLPPRELPRKTSVFLGSLVVLEAFEAAL